MKLPRDAPDHSLCEALYATAFVTGVEVGRQLEYGRIGQVCLDVAASCAELDATWRTIGRQTYEEKVAARVASLHATTPGPWDIRRGDHPGGPVDWSTGRPIGRRPVVDQTPQGRQPHRRPGPLPGWTDADIADRAIAGILADREVTA